MVMFRSESFNIIWYHLVMNLYDVSLSHGICSWIGQKKEGREH